ncbi:MAG: DEAD/DEAH box helicase family protein [Lachnospiraceae bacterium]|nr:DEAD/DEAH box helicase family protein [Lachnospiraceae bacterium]
MNNWKARLIAYVDSLDESISIDEADKLIHDELTCIKEECSAELSNRNNKADNYDRLDKSMEMPELIALYRDLFYGRQDVFAVRWENEKAGTHRYAPKCKNEWDRNICGKSHKIKGACKKCAYRENQEITDKLIQQHFTGTGRNALVMGVYPLLEDETCRFLAIDFDKGNWQDEILLARSIFTEYGIESYIERSRSGNGGHLWVFFSERVEAHLARKLGIKVLETAMNRTGSSEFDSFDRLFPNQDHMPKGGYGNLIALIAERQVNTLIIVDRVSLLNQWCERLAVFLNIPKKEIGVIGGGKKNPNGKIDVAVSQSLYRDNKVSELVKGYGQIICDECHHVSAVGFEQILKNSPAKYKYGLTATLKRKDGKERIVLMQLGPVCYKDLSKVTSELEHKVYVQETGIAPDRLKDEHTTNELYDYLYINPIRNMQIVMDVRNCLDEKRYPIVLTERKEHIELLEEALSPYAKVYRLYGGLKKKEKEAVMDELQNLSEDTRRVIIATSKYVGEGFDYPILDTLFLTLPISWSGRVKQYAGRLHRDYHEKKEVRIYDYLDSQIGDAMRMYGKRSKGYRSMGYEIIEDIEDNK